MSKFWQHLGYIYKKLWSGSHVALYTRTHLLGKGGPSFEWAQFSHKLDAALQSHNHSQKHMMVGYMLICSYSKWFKECNGMILTEEMLWFLAPVGCIHSCHLLVVSEPWWKALVLKISGGRPIWWGGLKKLLATLPHQVLPSISLNSPTNTKASRKPWRYYCFRWHNAPSSTGDILADSCKHPTGRLWVHCFILPVAIMLLFIRAEREGNWSLHVFGMEPMIPYFFNAGHWSYARYITHHCLELKYISEDVRKVLDRGEPVCRHIPRVWDDVFADKFGEQSSKGATGQPRISTFKYKIIGVWAV